jgi:hypothetical protein
MAKSKISEGQSQRVNQPFKFSLNVIRKYLDEKIYEKRGITKEEYISQCLQLWNSESDFDPEWQDKIIVDFLAKPDPYEILVINGYRLEYINNRLREIAIEKAETRTDIACFIIGFRPDKDGLFNQIKEKPHLGTYFLKDENSNPDDYYLGYFFLVEYDKIKKKYHSDFLKNKYAQILKNIEKWSYPNEKINVELPKPQLITSFTKKTISIWAKAIPEDLTFFISRCADLLVESLHENLAMVGAISYGSGTINMSLNIHSGEIVEDAEAMNSLQQWIGGTFCSSFIVNNLMLENPPKFILPEISEELVVPLYFQHLKPIYHPCIPYLTIDLPYRWGLRYPNENILDYLGNLKKRLRLLKKFIIRI